MKCKNLRIRTEKYQRYIYCIQKKKKIQYIECKECKYKEFKQQKELKKKSEEWKEYSKAVLDVMGGVCFG